MPRFYFHFKSGEIIAEDEVGVELPGLEEAVAMACASAHDLRTLVEAIMVVDASGRQLLTVAATEAHLSEVGGRPDRVEPYSPVRFPSRPAPTGALLKEDCLVV